MFYLKSIEIMLIKLYPNSRKNHKSDIKEGAKNENKAYVKNLFNIFMRSFDYYFIVFCLRLFVSQKQS